MATGAMRTFDINIRRASYFLDIHQQVHAGTHGAPVLALRELPRGALVFAVGALDAYLSDVSAEVIIHQCEQGLRVGGANIYRGSSGTRPAEPCSEPRQA